IFQRSAPFDQQQTDILNQLATQDFLIIFANPSLAAAKQRYLDRQDPSQKLKLEQLDLAHQLFDQWFFDHPWPNVLTYRSQNFEEMHQLIDRIQTTLKRPS